MHIQITDFGSALILNHDNSMRTTSPPSVQSSNESEAILKRRNSFVGTAHYVSPEMLTNKSATANSDLWAFGCILYQMIAGLPPFRAPNEYLIFQKIINLEYEFPEGFNEAALNLVENLLQISPSKRLGANDDIHTNGYVSIKEHEFFIPLAKNWSLINETPPTIARYLSGDTANDEPRNKFDTTENLEPGLAERQITRLMGLSLHEDFDKPNINTKKGILDISPKEMNEKLRIQKERNIFHRFVEENLILKQGFIDKKKGLFARRRMFLLTTGPHLYYVDAPNMVLKGQVPWSKDMRAVAKNFRTFYVHTVSHSFVYNLFKIGIIFHLFVQIIFSPIEHIFWKTLWEKRPNGVELLKKLEITRIAYLPMTIFPTAVVIYVTVM
jgi:3-phosphoinositide dependent protein kinase-1